MPTVLIDGLAQFWGLEDVDEAVLHQDGQEDVPWFSLPENDCESESEEQAAEISSLATPLRSLRGIDASCTLLRKPRRMADVVGASARVHVKYQPVLALHVLFCLTLTAFLLLSSCCLVLMLLYHMYVVITT